MSFRNFIGHYFLLQRDKLINRKAPWTTSEEIQYSAVFPVTVHQRQGLSVTQTNVRELSRFKDK